VFCGQLCVQPHCTHRKRQEPIPLTNICHRCTAAPDTPVDRHCDQGDIGCRSTANVVARVCSLHQQVCRIGRLTTARCLRSSTVRVAPATNLPCGCLRRGFSCVSPTRIVGHLLLLPVTTYYTVVRHHG